MNNRTITWLLAALLAISANAAVPVVRIRAGNGDSAIVWIAQDRSEQRVQILARPAAPEAQLAVLVTYEAPATTRQFSASLYQRPPPSLR